MFYKMKDYTGISKNNLTAIKFIKKESGRQFWEFQCTCGQIKIYRVDRVLSCKYRETKCNCNSKSDIPTRKALFRKYILGAKERNYTFDLSYLIFNKLISDNCHYCGTLPCVNHKDGNTLNSKLNNLEWCTFSENELHSFRVLGKKHGMIGIKGYDNSKNIIQMDLLGNFIKEFPSANQASEILKIDGSTITKVCRGKRKKCGGFMWKYKKD